jgi:hypothetical protein
LPATERYSDGLSTPVLLEKFDPNGGVGRIPGSGHSYRIAFIQADPALDGIIYSIFRRIKRVIFCWSGTGPTMFRLCLSKGTGREFLYGFGLSDFLDRRPARRPVPAA